MNKLIGIIAGLVALFVTVWVVEAIGHSIFPPPPGIDLSDPATMRTAMDSIPFGAKAAALIGWFLGALAGAWTALAIARWPAAGWIVVAIGTAMGVITLFMIPHPLWMQVAAVLLPPLGGWVATRLSRPVA